MATCCPCLAGVAGATTAAVGSFLGQYLAEYHPDLYDKLGGEVGMSVITVGAAGAAYALTAYGVYNWYHSDNEHDASQENPLETGHENIAGEI